MQPLTEYVEEQLPRAWPSSAGPQPAASSALAAATLAYAFRHSEAVSPPLLRARITALRRASGARGSKWIVMFLYVLEGVIRAYYSEHWHHLSLFFRANRAAYVALAEEVRARRAGSKQAEGETGVVAGGAEDLHRAVQRHGTVLLLFEADFCCHCRSLRPVFDAVAASAAAEGRGACLSVNGPEYLDLCEAYNVTRFPTILRFTGDDDEPLCFPPRATRSYTNLRHFLEHGSLPQEEAAHQQHSAAEVCPRPTTPLRPSDPTTQAGVAEMAKGEEELRSQQDPGSTALDTETERHSTDEEDPSCGTCRLPTRESDRSDTDTATSEAHTHVTGAAQNENDSVGECGSSISSEQVASACEAPAVDAASELSTSTDGGAEGNDSEAETTDAAELRSWREILQQAGIDLVENLEDARRLRLTKLRREIQPPTEVPHDRTLPPCIFFTGGGIASGKSGALDHLFASDFWGEYGQDVVRVAPDDIKSGDPLFRALQAAGVEHASVVVHSESTAAAETMLLDAVNHRRDVLFDGTMQWAPFIRQTVAMLRDDSYLYEQGPGYRKEADGSVTEEYWKRQHKREAPAPSYRLIMLGVTLDAAMALRRGVERWIVTGRAPSPSQVILQSHKLFSAHFEEYAELFDEAFLFDRAPAAPHIDSKIMDEPPESPVATPSIPSSAFVVTRPEGSSYSHVIACKLASASDNLRVLSPERFERFLHKAKINVDASGAAELFSEQPSSGSTVPAAGAGGPSITSSEASGSEN